MSRPIKCRRICKEPSYNSFVPEGIVAENIIHLSIDEYEVVRLLDYEMKTQRECAQQLMVSRTTVTDMYSKARYKIADGLIHGKKIMIGGGNYTLCKGENRCHQCFMNENILKQKSLKEKEKKIMRIAVTYENGEVFQHFGHTSEFKVYDVENEKIVNQEVLPTMGVGHGALAGFLKSNQVDILICGGIGGGAQNALAEANIKLYGGVSGKADEIVMNFINHTLSYNENVTCDHHNHESLDHHCGGHCHD